MNNFDSVASFYDRLSRLIFGNSIQNAQTLYLPDIPLGANVLILGGGTGWLLRELLAKKPDCKIWYIEASEKMISLSKEAIRETSHEVTFIHGTEDCIPHGITFHVVITYFYLDLFSAGSCSRVIQKIRSSIHVNGLWLVADFVNTTWWHGVILGMMYRFFRIMCSIETNVLPKWKNLVGESGFSELKHQEFFGSFIRSALFQLKR